jgi:hypothetical protein
MVSVIVQARKPADAPPLIDLSRKPLDMAASGCCGGDGCC